MRSILGAAVVAGIVGIAAPWVAMARRGTLDEQALASMREPVVPAPRRAPDDLPVRTAPVPPRRRERHRPPSDEAGCATHPVEMVRPGADSAVRDR
ncbi:hypothetical protein [Actinomycetospora atypica]|uniref:Uncharacterized protein n=1 Tax=Actinomycetospora atypica TaxID=1290095 RepID=A0ABV9YHV8_9PSEU